MRILYIACGSGGDQTMGGSLLRTIQVAKNIALNNDVKILTTSGGKSAIKRYIDTSKIIEVKCILCKENNDQFFLLKLIYSHITSIIKSAIKINEMNNIDIIYLDSDGLWDIIPALFYKIKHRNIKIISMNHHIISPRKDNSISLFFSRINITLQKIGQILISKYADSIFVLDTKMGNTIIESYEKMGFKKSFYKVKNGVDFNAINDILEQKKIYDGCFFGYLRPSKGLYYIAPIWAKVVSKKPNAKLLIIGGMIKQYKSELMNDLKKYNLLGNVIFTDYLNDKSQAIKYVKQSRIGISPSEEEGWGIALFESMACGLPVITWNIDSFEDISTKGMDKVEPYNVNEFASEILRLLSSTSEQEEMGLASISYAKQYDWKNVASEELKYLSKIYRGQ